MRANAFFFAMIAFAAAGIAAPELARIGAERLETATRARVEEAMRAADKPWVQVGADGLRVSLAGEAPDEASRARAMGVALRFVPEDRIDDAMTVRATQDAPPPAFSLELLRDEARVSLIGLVPEGDPAGDGTGAKTGRAAILAGLGAAGLGDEGVSDMLETAARPAPEGWVEALAFGLTALDAAPRSKISIAPGNVRVTAGVESDRERRALEEKLRAARPEAVALDLDISAPRPVITPFAVDFTFADGSGRFTACSAETAEDVAAIAAAAAKLGATAAPDCAIGIGAATQDWAAAVTEGLDALGALGGGRFAIRDIEAVLTGPTGIAPERLEAVGARLDAALPAVLSLAVEMPAGGEPPPEERFEARLTPEGIARLSGTVRNPTSQAAILSYAAALFGPEQVEDATVLDPDLPEGWPGRVLVGIAALAQLRDGSLRVTPEELVLRGKGPNAATNAEVKALLAEKLGAEARADLAIAPLEVVVPAAGAVAGDPAGAAGAAGAKEFPGHCAEDVSAILESTGIAFDAGSSTIEEASHGTILAIADALRSCPTGRFEVGGHTDSRGSAEGNRALSEARAEAVAEALRAAGPPGLVLVAKGYGADQPVADDGTAEGRARNRRITFAALEPEPGAGLPTGSPVAQDPDHPGAVLPLPDGEAAPMDELPHDGAAPEGLVIEEGSGDDAE